MSRDAPGGHSHLEIDWKMSNTLLISMSVFCQHVQFSLPVISPIFLWKVKVPFRDHTVINYVGVKDLSPYRVGNYSFKRGNVRELIHHLAKGNIKGPAHSGL